MLRKLTGNSVSNKWNATERFARNICAWPCEVACDGVYEEFFGNSVTERAKYI